MRITKDQLIKLDELILQAHGTVACSLDPIANEEMLERFRRDLRAIRDLFNKES